MPMFSNHPPKGEKSFPSYKEFQETHAREFRCFPLERGVPLGKLYYGRYIIVKYDMGGYDGFCVYEAVDKVLGLWPRTVVYHRSVREAEIDIKEMYEGE